MWSSVIVVNSLCDSRAFLLSPLFHPSKHLALGLEALVRVVLQHPTREVPGHRFDDVLGLAGLEQVRDNRVAQVMEPEAGEAGGVSQRTPGRVPLARRLRRVELMVLARAPQVVGWGRVA